MRCTVLGRPRPANFSAAALVINPSNLEAAEKQRSSYRQPAAAATTAVEKTGPNTVHCKISTSKNSCPKKGQRPQKNLRKKGQIYPSNPPPPPISAPLLPLVFLFIAGLTFAHAIWDSGWRCLRGFAFPLDDICTLLHQCEVPSTVFGILHTALRLVHESHCIVILPRRRHIRYQL